MKNSNKKTPKTEQVKIRIGNFWESPILHILLAEEDEVIVARCLDFTISSHGSDEQDALKSLADALREYILSAVENDAVDTMFDPAYGKYWQMYHALEMEQSVNRLKTSVKDILKSVTDKKLFQTPAEIEYV